MRVRVCIDACVSAYDNTDASFRQLYVELLMHGSFFTCQMKQPRFDQFLKSACEVKLMSD